MELETTWKSLCERLIRSDLRALEEVFRTVRDDLLRYVRAIVHDPALAHDLVQDVFLALWEVRASLDPARPLPAYLFRMARNRAYRHLRDVGIHSGKRDLLKWELLDTHSGPSPEEIYEAAVLGTRLEHWLSELPLRQREALVLSRFGDKSHQEIAAIMDISPRTVNNHIVRALEHLQGRLQELETRA